MSVAEPRECLSDLYLKVNLILRQLKKGLDSVVLAQRRIPNSLGIGVGMAPFHHLENLVSLHGVALMASRENAHHHHSQVFLTKSATGDRHARYQK